MTQQYDNHLVHYLWGTNFSCLVYRGLTLQRRQHVKHRPSPLAPSMKLHGRSLMRNVASMLITPSVSAVPMRVTRVYARFVRLRQVPPLLNPLIKCLNLDSTCRKKKRRRTRRSKNTAFVTSLLSCYFTLLYAAQKHLSAFEALDHSLHVTRAYGYAISFLRLTCGNRSHYVCD